MSAKYPEPKEPEYLAVGHCRYNGRDFYGVNADLRSEVTYLREWRQWATIRLAGLEAFHTSVHESLNSGDGSYRP